MLHKATEKGIFIDFSYDETLPLFFLSDPLRISQILNNLLSNAIKFTRTGGVTIKISHYGIIDSRVAVGFSVSDTGIGIPKEMHEHIFAEFTQASSDTSRNYGGTGLGLAITVKLLEMLGSSIQLESEPEKGSLFSFVIKMKEGQVSRNLLPDGMPGKENQRFNGQRILLVEDNVINEVIARKFMEDWNLNVDSASNGLEAIEKLNQENFHLILMDLQMPEMDGYMTTSIIRGRGHEPFISIPIIALTASSKSEVQDEIMLAGMNDFVSKPFNPDELWGKLKKYLKV
ncbi:MAG: ATP-binding protein [Lentimicrobium sp.]|jgi:CheY-like chemotaxis protein|nr:ATP-binding protein [Lentimicrobium sp.]